MTHIDAELLAQWALDGEPSDAPDHLRTCPECQAELEALRELVDTAHASTPLEPVPPAVWDRVVAEVGTPPGRKVSRLFRHRTVLLVAAAAVVGILLGVLGVGLLTPEGRSPVNLAEVSLEPLEGKAGTGTADLVRIDEDGSETTQLEVRATDLPVAPGFYEVWLINLDGTRMISLGVLDPRTATSFVVPPTLTGQGYRIVDVSLEPFDGKPEHSRDSVIRGTLPA